MDANAQAEPVPENDRPVILAAVPLQDSPYNPEKNVITVKIDKKTGDALERTWEENEDNGSGSLAVVFYTAGNPPRDLASCTQVTYPPQNFSYSFNVFSRATTVTVRGPTFTGPADSECYWTDTKILKGGIDSLKEKRTAHNNFAPGA